MTCPCAKAVCCGSYCLDEAIPKEERKKLISNASNASSNRPLGIWSIYGQKFQVDTPVALLQILVEEVLGYEVFVDASGTGNIQDAFYALAGCEQPENKTNQSCTGKSTHHHVAMGLHVGNNITRLHYERVQRLRMGGMLEDLGSVGFVSQSGLQISSFTMQKALESKTPLFLDDFRNYDARYHRPQRFFLRPQQIDETLLIPCDQWVFDPTESVVLAAVDSALNCSGNWWLAPSCQSGDCIACITPSNGNKVIYGAEIMQKAAWFKTKDSTLRAI